MSWTYSLWIIIILYMGCYRYIIIHLNILSAIRNAEFAILFWDRNGEVYCRLCLWLSVIEPLVSIITIWRGQKESRLPVVGYMQVVRAKNRQRNEWGPISQVLFLQCMKTSSINDEIYLPIYTAVWKLLVQCMRLYLNTCLTIFNPLWGGICIIITMEPLLNGLSSQKREQISTPKIN